MHESMELALIVLLETARGLRGQRTPFRPPWMISDPWRYSRPLATSSSYGSNQRFGLWNQRPGSYQADPICPVFADIVEDISVRHHLGNHRKFAGVGFDFDCDKRQNVWMRRVHPYHAFLAEALGSIFRVDQSSRIGDPIPLRTSCIALISASCDMRIVFTATFIPLYLPFRMSANPPLAIMVFSTLHLENVPT